MPDLEALTAVEAVARIAAGTLGPQALTEACLARIRKRDAELAAWFHVDEAGARAAAREREAEARGGRRRGPLHGVPVGIKDIIDVAGMTTTAGAAGFAHVRAVADAACVARLRAAGAIVLGKTATTEFAYFEPAGTRNPWNAAHTPGGSSSGSAAAVAARMVPLALGTQTVGSVLRPAAYCGVVGFKGTHGAVAVDGVVPLAWSLDHVGVFARSVADVRLAFTVLAGRHVASPSPSTPRLGLAHELLGRASPEVSSQIRAACERLAVAGAVVSEVTLPASFASIHEAGQAVLQGEAATYHEPLHRAHAADYRPRTRALIEAGLAQRAVDYVRAQQARRRFRDDVMPRLAGVDALVTPAAPSTAPRGLGSTGDPWFCAPWTFAGVPAITLPATVSSDGLPHAIQLVGAADADARLLGVAEWCESILGTGAAPPG